MAAAAAAAALAWRACAPRPAPPFCQQRRALPPGTNYFLQRDFAVNLLYAGRGGAEAPARASGEARLPAAAARCLGALPWLRAGPRAAWRQVQGAVPWRAAGARSPSLQCTWACMGRFVDAHAAAGTRDMVLSFVLDLRAAWLQKHMSCSWSWSRATTRIFGRSACSALADGGCRTSCSDEGR